MRDPCGGEIVLMVLRSHWKHWLHFGIVFGVSEADGNADFPALSVYTSAPAWICL